MWGIHVRPGTHTVDATNSYRQPELSEELARCQRYYWQSDTLPIGTNLIDIHASAAGMTLISAAVDAIPVKMWALPSVTVPVGSTTNISSSAFTARGQLIVNSGAATAIGRVRYSLLVAGVIKAEAEIF